jgi:monoamine oxidase
MGASAGLLAPAMLSSCKDDEIRPEIQYDGVVGIIGAGVAGLHVADILRSKGVNVKIFEASGRIGGRVRSFSKNNTPSASLLFDPANLPISTYPAELGASFVMGSDSAWGKIVSQLGVQVVEYTPDEKDNFIIDGVVKSYADLQGDADFIAAYNFYKNLKSNSGTGTVQQAIAAAGLNARTQAILTSWIGNKLGTANDKLGIKSLTEELSARNRNNNQFVLKSNPMQDAVLSRFNAVVPFVELNSIVTGINYSGEKILITGQKNGTAESFGTEVDRLVVTVPVSILKAGTISFSPSLPSAKTTALSRMDMEAAIRVRLEFKNNFWGQQSAFIYGGTTAPEYFNAGRNRDDLERSLDITVHGPKAAQLSAKGKGMINDILAELDALYAGKATQNIRLDPQDNKLFLIMDWTKEEYIQGGIAYVKAGGTNQDRIDLSSSVDNKLFFAGEATDVAGEAGTISGALQSAERASLEVVNSIVV